MSAIETPCPAHAAMRFEEKHKRWKTIKQACDPEFIDGRPRDPTTEFRAWRRP
jgi:hypothetical protein